MKLKVLLVLVVFIISVFLGSCTKNDRKLDVEGYREGLKSSQKKSMPIEQKKEIEKSIFPNIKQK